VPGVGKSSFIEKFGEELLSYKNKLAVLAIDPSSEKTGGSILGDKTRMETLSNNERVFIRPSASGSTLGGVARKTRETIILCEAAGYDVILIETVGVGQSETVVHSMVDFFLLLLLAGAGDELQGIKRGIMEMADGFVVTKCDGDNVNPSRLAASELRSAIKLFPPNSSGWKPEVILSSAMTKLGLDKILKMIQTFEQQSSENGTFIAHRKQQNLTWMHETLRELYFQNMWSNSAIHDYMKNKETEVQEGKTSAFQAAEDVFEHYINYLIQHKK
jgi:LAO/AO transport system kinase